MERIAPGIYRMRFGEPEALTPVLLRRNEMDREGLSRLPENRCIFTEKDMSFTVTARGCTLALPLTPDEGIYGLGLQLKSFNQRGLKKTLRTNSDPVADTGDSHAPVPFYCSTAGYGILVDTARYVTFYCGTHDRKEAGTSADGSDALRAGASMMQGATSMLRGGANKQQGAGNEAVEKTGEISREISGEKSGEISREISGEKSGEISGEKTGEKTGEISGEKSGEISREISGESKSNVIGANPAELYSLKEQRNIRSMIADIPAAKGVDVYLFEGPQMIHAVQRYNLFSGGGCLPPMWGLGVWYRAWGKSDAGHAKELADYMRKAEMPCDVFGFEPGWHSHAYSCSYEWDSTLFPQPDELVEQLNQNDFKVNLWEHAFVHPSAPFHNDIAPSSGDTLVWGGLVPDFTLDEARKQFGNHHRDHFLKKGITGFKLDECDSSDYCPSPWSFPDFATFPSGLDGEQMHSLLGVLYQHTLLDLFMEEDMRTLGQCRSSHALAAPLPFVLYSDLYDHGDFIRGVVNSGFSGLLWSPEVRQCDSVEDLIRRLQAVVFSAQALINAWMIPNPPWLQFDLDKNMQNIYLENAKEVEQICRDLFQLRMSLIPYLYSAFSEYRFKGIPPFRALVLDYPDDAQTHSIDDEYLVGRHLLVAPVLTGCCSRRVYLPQGKWYCFWTNKPYEGGQWHDITVPLEQIPVFVRDNSLLPMAEPVEAVTEHTCFKLHVRAYGTQPCDFSLFEDDHQTFDFEKGEYNIVVLKWDETGIVLQRTGSCPVKKYDVVSWEIIQ